MATQPRGRRSLEKQPPPTFAQVKRTLERIIERHRDAGEPDLELMPDPEAPWSAYRMVAHLLELYASGAEYRRGHQVREEVCAGDHRDLLLLQRFIETRGAYAGLLSAHDHQVHYRSLVDGTHIQGPSTPQQRFNTLHRALGNGQSPQAREVQQTRSRAQQYNANNLNDAVAIAREVVSAAEANEFDVTPEGHADLLWVYEQLGEIDRGIGGEQLPTALRCLVEDLHDNGDAHSESGKLVLKKAEQWRRVYRKAIES